MVNLVASHVVAQRARLKPYTFHFVDTIASTGSSQDLWLKYVWFQWTDKKKYLVGLVASSELAGHHFGRLFG